MQQLKKEMRSVKKCLAAAFSLLVSLSLNAQEVEYINHDDYYWGFGKTTKEAIADLKSKVNDVVTVAVKTTLKTSNGKQTYDSNTGTEAYFTLPESGITLIPMEGYWRAGIEKEKVKHIDGNWVEQNITINNTTDRCCEPQRASREFFSRQDHNHQDQAQLEWAVWIYVEALKDGIESDRFIGKMSFRIMHQPFREGIFFIWP